MAGRNAELQHIMGCRSFQMMQAMVLSTLPCRVHVPRWLWILDIHSANEASAQSLTQLFPWAAMDLWTLAAARALWILVATSLMLGYLTKQSPLINAIPQASGPVFAFATVLYVVLLATFVSLLHSAGYIVQRMPNGAFSRSKPMEIESEFVWQPALREYKNASSRMCFYLLMCVTLIAVLGYSYERGPSNQWLVQKLSQCRALSSRDPNSQPLVVDLITADRNFQHSISQPVINRAGFDSKYSDSLGSYYKIFCYPQRMFMHEFTWVTFEQCMSSAKVPWTAAWEINNKVDEVVLACIVGIWVACLLLLLSRCLVSK